MRKPLLRRDPIHRLLEAQVAELVGRRHGVQLVLPLLSLRVGLHHQRPGLLLLLQLLNLG